MTLSQAQRERSHTILRFHKKTEMLAQKVLNIEIIAISDGFRYRGHSFIISVCSVTNVFM